MPSFKSAVLAAAVALPTLSFADSAINYDYVQASFAKSKLDSPASGEPEKTTATVLELQKDLGYQVVASVSAGFVELKDRYETDEARYGADVDQRTLRIAIDRYFQITPTLHFIPGLSYSEIKSDVETKFQRTDVNFFFSESTVTYTDSSALNLETRYRLSEYSPLELSGTVSYATGEEEDSIIVDLSAELNISDILSGRFSYQKDIENAAPAYVYGIRVYF
ncbi:MAG TPA: hypothetical protein DE015_09100 [Oceanospirillales bacterium]|nr:hypothetical protein [Oceanospirillales bacterium]